MRGIFDELGLTVLERGWLSSNNIIFHASSRAPATLVDSGYGSHSEQTLSLVRACLGDERLERVVNTHLHSDHCGGNAALSRRFAAEIWVPEAGFDAAHHWDEAALSFAATGQSCERFPVHGAVRPGAKLELGNASWEVWGAAGHDPDAVMLFEPQSRVLISADALWEDRLAIIFPEIAGEPGFNEARAVLDLIEELAPRVVIPGHGRAFTNVGDALACSRRRLSQFELDPARHLRYASRALTMFHMLEVRRSSQLGLIEWLISTPIFGQLQVGLSADLPDLQEFATQVVDQLVRDGLLLQDTMFDVVVP